MKRTTTKFLVAVSLACMGLIGVTGPAHAEQTVQGSQNSTGSTADSGGSAGSNTSNFNGGPSATGSTSANSQQLGNNQGTVSQTGKAKTGDSVAGGQVTGAVGRDVTVQNQNNADGASATTGDADITNTLTAILGPFADGGTGTAQSSQVGHNTLDASQTGAAETGDSVSASQVTGIVGGGEHTVQNQNVALNSDSDTGNSDVTQDLFASNGPYATADDTAQAGQIGDNDAVLSQSATTTTGDSLTGAQVTGVVGGSATVQNQNTSENSDADSGDSTVANNIDAENLYAIAGPEASADNAQATQNGNNAIDAAQEAHAATGDAVAGGQVTGGVGDNGGFFTVQNQQASDNDDANTGDIFADDANYIDSEVGPQADGSTNGTVSQIGDNDTAIGQLFDGQTGDAIAAGQVTGAVNYDEVTVQNQNTSDGRSDATSGDVNADDANFLYSYGIYASGDTASASQIGDNTTSIGQQLTAASGDAVSGAQITGIVGGTDITVQNSNSAVCAPRDTEECFRQGPYAETGEVDAEQESNVYASVEVSGGDSSQATQNGNNVVTIAQALDATTGDAVAGAQVTGVVADNNATVTVQNSNVTENAEAISGDVEDADQSIFFNDGAGPYASGGDAQASQIGDNTLVVDQALTAGTGDAVAGAQVTGVVAGSNADITIQNSNNDEDSSAISGDNDSVAQEAEFDVVGPFADGDSAQATQNGDNIVAVSQSLDATSGDAVAGAQVTGTVAGANSDTTVQNSNFADGSFSESGNVDAFNEVEYNSNSLSAVTVGPVAYATDGAPQASQIGDNAASFDQSLNAASGDAVAGSQVTGTVSGNGSETTVQNTNTAEDTEAISGDSNGNNYLTDLFVGPNAYCDGCGTAASAEQIGDNSLDFSQAVNVTSGDAVAGSQVTGTVGGDATVQTSNNDDSSDATSGSADGTNDANGGLGATANSDTDAALVQSVGDNVFAGSQDLGTSTGDAVAGAQVSGGVGTDLATL